MAIWSHITWLKIDKSLSLCTSSFIRRTADIIIQIVRHREDGGPELWLGCRAFSFFVPAVLLSIFNSLIFSSFSVSLWSSILGDPGKIGEPWYIRN